MASRRSGNCIDPRDIVSHNVVSARYMSYGVIESEEKLMPLIGSFVLGRVSPG